MTQPTLDALRAVTDAVHDTTTALREGPTLIPADLSAHVQATQELTRELRGLVEVLAARFPVLEGVLRHDTGGDPALSASLAYALLTSVALSLADVDVWFQDAHAESAHIGLAWGTIAAD
jgi:hypothetical protein